MKFEAALKILQTITCHDNSISRKECKYLFCELHKPKYLGQHKDTGHVCIGCGLDESIGFVERFLSESFDLTTKNDSNINYLFTNYILLLYLTVEKFQTIFKFIGITYEYVEEKWPVLIEIRKWANFIKHPKGFMFTHHPNFKFENERINRKNKTRQFVDKEFVNKFYFREDELKLKQTMLEVANKDNITIILPDVERIAIEFTKVCHEFCEKIKLNEHFKEILKSKVYIDKD